MNKRINFEDTVFILNIRIRMIRDLLLLDTDANIFFRQTTTDIEFINNVLNTLTEKFLENIKFLDIDTEAETLADGEWQFNQLLNEISNNTSPFSPDKFPEVRALIERLRKDSRKRQKQIEESYVPNNFSSNEPVVSSAEINGLLAAL